MAEEIKITLETLYDFLRNEKKREDLQKLESTFYVDVVSYVREKKSLLADQKDSDNPFATGEKEKLEYELRSIKRILKEIHEKREKKIIDIALNRSRTGSNIIDTSSMLREEKVFYTKLLANLDIYRHGVLLKLFQGELPDLGMDHPQINIEVPKPVVKEEVTSQPNESATPEETSSEEKHKIKFLHAVPSFVWKDMKVYGPFEVGDETEIFPEVAALLVRKGRAEKV
ncbi:DNA replication complex GINS family protein [Candidatus Woesearchaeota archaeon]|jgi:DNA replication initiation complex subunit (GINS family)|nr:DNA replication complex GINS family protein [Candidatus Woesearchaeota archaeon]MBT4150650.1 DNA replication complex GINS family protein [Candidatus Woesearchaeota archaeon]MBT4247868.1 DNA replication complex GINS family protein [Candidatus Woesearchaeota archaeon]MBT4434292.1 DNA replication complex GINS family protein [Candidatus Woesearchaeota archaeon]MBT7331879.1 DNA replication complex GINS family protein [Candidatus Woesearchaeota archaeon]